jgi:chaperonin cofactor prefoldin
MKSIGHRLDMIADDLCFKEREHAKMEEKLNQIDKVLGELLKIDDNVTRFCIVNRGDMYTVNSTLSKIHRDIQEAQGRLEKEIVELAKGYDDLSNQYFEETGKSYIPERGEHPRSSSLTAPWLRGTGPDPIEPNWDMVSRG